MRRDYDAFTALIELRSPGPSKDLKKNIMRTKFHAEERDVKDINLIRRITGGNFLILPA